MSVRRKSLRAALIAVVSACLLATPALATITDDIDPVGRQVRLRLINLEQAPTKGVVEVTATLADGGTKTEARPFSLGPGETAKIMVGFASKVGSVVAVKITEGPDTI